jgi:glycosyltransferase involved in cell wall biosynthesis
MTTKPRVSAVVCFLNAEAFLEEAVESVFAQSFKSWELLLVDDGSTDSSTAIARGYARENPDSVRYLEHPGHRNRGLSASRNLSISNAMGDCIAFLDSDDVWLPRKLEEQVAILDSYPQVALLFGATQYWHSWADQNSQPDEIEMPGVPTGRVYEPPALLNPLLEEVCSAGMSNFIFRKQFVSRIGGFEEQFIAAPAMYEDQAFLTKVYLNLPVYVSHECWDRYRIHPNQICAKVIRDGKKPAATAFYLRWAENYLHGQGALDPETRNLIRRRLWPNEHPLLNRLLHAGRR